MGAIDYLRNHGLNADPLPGNRLSVWPADRITPAIRVWLQHHKPDVMRDLLPANDDTRLAWRVLFDGNPVATMVGKPMNYKQALEAATARWPNENVTIKEGS